MNSKIKKLMKQVKADLIREDGRLERVCEHGVGHTVGHVRGYFIDRYETVHGCCSCHQDDWPHHEIKNVEKSN